MIRGEMHTHELSKSWFVIRNPSLEKNLISFCKEMNRKLTRSILFFLAVTQWRKSNHGDNKKHLKLSSSFAHYFLKNCLFIHVIFHFLTTNSANRITITARNGRSEMLPSDLEMYLELLRFGKIQYIWIQKSDGKISGLVVLDDWSQEAQRLLYLKKPQERFRVIFLIFFLFSSYTVKCLSTHFFKFQFQINSFPNYTGKLSKHTGKLLNYFQNTQALTKAESKLVARSRYS